MANTPASATTSASTTLISEFAEPDIKYVLAQLRLTEEQLTRANRRAELAFKVVAETGDSEIIRGLSLNT